MKVQTFGPAASDIIPPHEIHRYGYIVLFRLLSHPGMAPRQMKEHFTVYIDWVEFTQRLVAEGFLRFGDWRNSFDKSPLYPTLGLKAYILANFDLTTAERKNVEDYEVVDWDGYFETGDWEAVF